jgi:argininosuccinate lyase
MTYNRDMQEDKEPVFDALDTVHAALAVFTGMLEGIRANAAACAAAVADPNLLATDLADYLVKRGVPFRQAHEVIGRAVALCAERGCELPELKLEDYRSLSSAFAADLFDMLNLQAAMRARTAIGAPSPENVAAELARWRKDLGGPAAAQ